MASDPFLPLDSLARFGEQSASVGYRTPDPPAAELQTISAALARWSAAKGDSPALLGSGAGSVTFAQLLASIASIASDLGNAGLKREDRVGLVVASGVVNAQLVVALASNVALVPINPALTEREISEIAAVTGLKAFVIPQWLETPARSAILDQGITTLEAALDASGALGLQLLTHAAGERAPLRRASETDVVLLLRSSGTTGAPKWIPVTHRNLVAMAAKLGSDRWFHLTANDRAACTLPLYYAAGLKTTLFVPLILGASVSFPPAGQALDLPQWVDVLQPTYLSVSPGLLNGVLDRLRATGNGFHARSLRFVMCSGAYLPEPVRLAAQAVLQVPLLEFYGLSEAGIMAANPVPPGKAKPGTVGLPSPGELLIVDANRDAVKHGSVGHIMISGPSVMPGYVMAGDSSSDAMRGGWLLTGDLGRIDEDGYLTIVGRVSEVINRGGEKVFPYEIEKAMLEHPAVLEAAAFGVPHPRLGESVAAAVVLKPGSALSEQELKQFLAGRLATFKLPRAVHLMASLPRGSTGKVLRGALGSAHAALRRDIVAPERLLQLELLDLWERLLGTDDIDIDVDFFDGGGDSLLATEMLIEVEKLVGKPYPQSELSLLTIRHMADVLTSRLPAERDLITQVKTGSGIPLFLCHGDYVARGIYAQKLAVLLADDRPVFLLHSYADHPIGSGIEEIARAYLPEISRVAPGTPVFVAGYCNGGLIAWHLAHLLRSSGIEVARLLLLDTISLNARPHLRRLRSLLTALSRFVPGRAGTFLRDEAMRAVWFVRRRLAVFTYDAARRKMFSLLRHTPPRRDAFTDTDRMYLGFMTRYLPPPVDVDVTCFIATEGRHFDTDPLAWRPLARSVDEVCVPGTHHTVLISGRKALAAALGESMNQAVARSASS